jgi:large subunit ribosomal protein L10
MPLTKVDKTELLQVYEQGLAASPHAFLLDYQGIKVPQVTALREKVRQSGGEYVVVKNTIALRAIDGNALSQLKEHFVGPTAVAYGKDPVALAKTLTEFAKEAPVLQFKAGLVEGRAIDGNALGQLKEHFVGPTAVAFGKDPVALAKALTDFAKDVPVRQFKAGLVEGRAVAATQITDIASLPSREELIAKLLFLIQSPVTRFVRVLAAVPQSFVMVLDQVRQKKEGPAEATETKETAA